LDVHPNLDDFIIRR